MRDMFHGKPIVDIVLNHTIRVIGCYHEIICDKTPIVDYNTHLSCSLLL